MDNNISLLISILSLSISLFTFLYTWNTNKMNLKVKIRDVSASYDDNNLKCIVIKCTINNKSKNSISINTINLKTPNKIYPCINKKSNFGGYSYTFMGQEYKTDITSSKLPIKLLPYDSLINAIPFVIPTDVKIPKKIKIIFSTSRGEKLFIIKKHYINEIQN